jgi:hypothetical protein
MIIHCASCGFDNAFEQPYPYHAGFADVGFLYNVEGNRTLVWSIVDPALVRLVGKDLPWSFTRGLQRRLEQALAPSPTGSAWLFSNPARCGRCSRRIGQPMMKDIHYLVFPGSVDVSRSLALDTVIIGHA